MHVQSQVRFESFFLGGGRILSNQKAPYFVNDSKVSNCLVESHDFPTEAEQIVKSLGESSPPRYASAQGNPFPIAASISSTITVLNHCVTLRFIL